MDITALLVKYLPPCALPKLKFLVTALGGAVSAVLATYPSADHRYVIASAALTALVTYLTPNIKAVKLMSSVSESVAPESQMLTYSNCPCDTPNVEAPVTQTAPAPVAQAPEQPHEIGV